MVLWVIIFIVVVAILIFITVNKKASAPTNSDLNDIASDQPADNNMQDNNGVSSAPDSGAEDTTQNLPGVQVTITKPGSGQAAKAGDTVAMNYTGRLSDGTVFDSNVDPKFNHVEPFVFTLGAGQVIKGWDTGIVGMKVGEKRTLVISPDYGYGATGTPGGPIPPNATLTFDVELLAIK